MAEPNNHNQSNATPIDPDRCTPGGLTGADAMDWALRAGLALLGLSALWLVLAVVRPLPGGAAQPPPPIPSIAAIHHATAPISQRQSRLASLDSGGNIFASDRRNWPVHIASAPAPGDEPGPPGGRKAPQTPSMSAASAGDIDSIELTDNASAAVKKRLDQLKLRGVYVANGVAAAMIGQKTNPGSESYRVGDTLDDGEWSLIAIDDLRDRVILSRSGQNFELNLYDTPSFARANPGPRSAINATNAPGDVEIDFTSLDKVASELREAGLPRDQINELITLAQEQTAADADTERKAGDAPADPTPAALVPAMPPGMVQLFKAMAEGSREVVLPPPATEPKPDDEDGAKSDPPEKKDKGDR